MQCRHTDFMDCVRGRCCILNLLHRNIVLCYSYTWEIPFAYVTQHNYSDMKIAWLHQGSGRSAML